MMLTSPALAPAARLRLSWNNPKGARSRAHSTIRCAQSPLTEEFNRKVKEARRKLENWAEQERIKERVKQASKAASSKVQQTFETVQDTVQRTAEQIDRQYDVKGKARQAAHKVRETADEVESKYGVWRKARNAFQDACRKWPTWRRQLGVFFNTSLGKIVGILLLTFALYSGLLFRLLNGLLMFLMLSPLLVGPYLRRKIMEQEHAQQEAYTRAQREAQQQQQQQQFVNDIFSRFQGGWTRQQQPPGGRAAEGFGGMSGRGFRSEGGSVIDVDWKAVNED